MALILTLFTMTPTLDAIKSAAYDPYVEGTITQEEFFDRAQDPLKDFMLNNTEINSLIASVSIAVLLSGLFLFPELPQPLAKIRPLLSAAGGRGAGPQPRLLLCQYGQANVVMCSAMGQETMVIDAIRSGAKDFIVKPFKIERVLKTVTSIVGEP